MPASRSARAITFAPRSCPSSPGFAISTRIFFVMRLSASIRSRNCYFLGCAKSVSHGVTDLPERRVRFHRIENKWHQVIFALGSGAQSRKLPRHFVVRTFRAHLPQPFRLALRTAFVNLQSLQRFFFVDKCIYADHQLFLVVQFSLVAI